MSLATNELLIARSKMHASACENADAFQQCGDDDQVDLPKTF
jgi:hypothetical protein